MAPSGNKPKTYIIYTKQDGNYVGNGFYWLKRDEKLGSVWNRSKARITAAGMDFDGSGVGSTSGAANESLREALKAVNDDLPNAVIPKRAWTLHEIYSYLIRENYMEKDVDEKLVPVPDEPSISGKSADNVPEKNNEETNMDEVIEKDHTPTEDDLRMELDKALSSSRIEKENSSEIHTDLNFEDNISLENVTEKVTDKQQGKTGKDKDIEKLNDTVLKLQAGVQSVDYGKIGEQIGKSIAPVIASNISKINSKNITDLKGVIRQITAEQIRPVIKSSIEEVKEAVKKLEKNQDIKDVEDEGEDDEPEWCSYCEVIGHNIENCHEIPQNHWCIRCLDDQHKEEKCPAKEDSCEKCLSAGHIQDLHDVKDPDMRSAIMTFHGTNNFKDDFFSTAKEDPKKRKNDEIIIKKEKYSKLDRPDNCYDDNRDGKEEYGGNNYVDEDGMYYNDDMEYEGTKSSRGRGDQGYGREDQGYSREAQGYGRGAQAYGRGDHDYGRGDQGYDRGDQAYGRGDQAYGRGDRGRGDRGRGDRGRGDRGRGDRGRGDRGRGDLGRGNRGRGDRGRGDRGRGDGRRGGYDSGFRGQEPRGRGSVPSRRPYQGKGPARYVSRRGSR